MIIWPTIDVKLCAQKSSMLIVSSFDYLTGNFIWTFLVSFALTEKDLSTNFKQYFTHKVSYT